MDAEESSQTARLRFCLPLRKRKIAPLPAKFSILVSRLENYLSDGAWKAFLYPGGEICGLAHFSAHLGSKNVPVPFRREGDSSISRLAGKSDSPRERLCFPPALGDELHFVRVHSGQPRARKEKRRSVRHGGLVVMRQYTTSKAVNRVN